MKTTSIAAILCSSVLIAGCSTVTSDSITKHEIKVKIEPDRSVLITNASITQHNGGLKVTGKLRPKSAVVRTVGHIHVSFLDLDGVAIRQLKVEPTGNVFFRKSVSRPKFSAFTSLVASDVFEVRLKHHDIHLEVCSFGVGTATAL